MMNGEQIKQAEDEIKAERTKQLLAFRRAIHEFALLEGAGRKLLPNEMTVMLIEEAALCAGVCALASANRTAAATAYIGQFVSLVAAVTEEDTLKTVGEKMLGLADEATN